MMKFNVVDDYRTVSVVEADTIDSLKAWIMECFSLKEEDLSERLLVRDDRVLWPGYVNPIVNGFDLLELEEGSILEHHFCNECLDDDGDTLLLGWKSSFIISMIWPSRYFNDDKSLNIEVDPYVTLGELKRLIASGTGEPVTEENLPAILFEADDEKPLLFFGYYKYFKGRDTIEYFRINRNRDNKWVVRNVARICSYRTQAKTPRYSGEKYDMDEDEKKPMMGTMDQYYRSILVSRNKFNETMNKGMEGDKEDAGPSYKLYKMSKKEIKVMEDSRNTYQGRKII